MACFLQLQQGGHLLLNAQSGALLLNVCNEGVQLLGGGVLDTYWDRVREALEEQSRIDREIKEAEDRLEEEKALQENTLEDVLEPFEDIEDSSLSALEEQIRHLMMQRLALEARIAMLRSEEDDILVILYSLPFMN